MAQERPQRTRAAKAQKARRRLLMVHLSAEVGAGLEGLQHLEGETHPEGLGASGRAGAKGEEVRAPDRARGRLVRVDLHGETYRPPGAEGFSPPPASDPGSPARRR